MRAFFVGMVAAFDTSLQDSSSPGNRNTVLSPDTIIKFRKVNVNVGGGYDSDTGETLKSYEHAIITVTALRVDVMRVK